MAKADMGRIAVLNSCHEVLEAASYRRGGRMTIKTISGSNARLGNCGTKPMTKPAATNKMGNGNFLLLTIAVRLIRIAIKKITTLNSSIHSQAT
jgi:hypothetical protein